MTNYLCCDWLKLYRDIIQLDCDTFSVLWLVEIISGQNWIMSHSMCGVLTQMANHTNTPFFAMQMSLPACINWSWHSMAGSKTREPIRAWPSIHLGDKRYNNRWPENSRGIIWFAWDIFGYLHVSSYHMEAWTQWQQFSNTFCCINMILVWF